ncbi:MULTISPECIES: D-aminoacyl-tRNA deacylase [unclassified Rhodococcus (in: high G+C Gram-positive bacteria)]|uniref:D-aminoacyl-tRNA deacylase n=1 Tax=unclassified Rhodococcus (in: high G+C Gram-positive bacteria) TaxID=192944 RepID=UPI001C9BB69E|nr:MULTISPECIES: D-aminoacyl-tRNA deacylase [unclassified Rhodococcus (in: high G+C Gram-positive bacteria)]MBY6705533.1 D-tyrosyl-tRNA(Tyr) deacylase [Rhodococcus sp. BP-241]MDQ1201532.1 D-tyrosyl-tRNA(Tyr) deacylase [Rhodococcus sp. SORGH_AS_0303]
MRAVIQRVSEATVRVDGVEVGRIGAGLLALVGVSPSDGGADVEYVARKIADLRILPDERSVSDDPDAAEVLVVSQFTLYGDTRKGRRPSWNGAASGDIAEPLVDAVVASLRARGITVATGVFGAHMAVQSVNDGPMTVLVDSP